MREGRSLVFGAVLDREQVMVRAVPEADQVTFVAGGHVLEVQLGEFADMVLKALVMAHSASKE